MRLLNAVRSMFNVRPYYPGFQISSLLLHVQTTDEDVAEELLDGLEGLRQNYPAQDVDFYMAGYSDKERLAEFKAVTNLPVRSIVESLKDAEAMMEEADVYAENGELLPARVTYCMAELVFNQRGLSRIPRYMWEETHPFPN